jgi:hypothetical protein
MPIAPMRTPTLTKHTQHLSRFHNLSKPEASQVTGRHLTRQEVKCGHNPHHSRHTHDTHSVSLPAPPVVHNGACMLQQEAPARAGGITYTQAQSIQSPGALLHPDGACTSSTDGNTRPPVKQLLHPGLWARGSIANADCVLLLGQKCSKGHTWCRHAPSSLRATAGIAAWRQCKRKHVCATITSRIQSRPPHAGNT